MPCSKARSTTSSGSTPTATATPPRSRTPTAAWWPSWRSQAIRPALRACWAWSPSGRGAVAAGRWRAPAATAPGWPASWPTGASGGRGRPAQAAPRPDRRQERRAGRHPGRPGSVESRAAGLPTPAWPARGAAGAAADPLGGGQGKRRRPPPPQGAAGHAPEPLRAEPRRGTWLRRPRHALRWSPHPPIRLSTGRRCRRCG
jgi:hypothetical protein